MIRIRLTRASILLAVLAACGPTNGAEDTHTPTDGASTTINTATGVSADSTSSANEQTDSSASTSVGADFGCPGARWHEGDLLVNGASDLDELRDIGGITGSLNVGRTTALVDLEFLSCLEVVDGTVWIHDNDSLTDLHGLEQLRAINGNSVVDIWELGITRNAALSRIDSLDSLEDIGRLVVGENEALVEIELTATRQIGTLLLGGYCIGDEAQSNQPLAEVGDYPVLEHVQTFVLYGQYEMISLDSLIELAERGVVFDSAYFQHNYNLPLAEIEAFAVVASIMPEACSNMDDLEQCSHCPSGD